MTTVVVPTSSFRDGQETLFSSFRTSRTNSTPLLMRSLILSKNSFIDRQSCGAPPLKDLAGQERLEPPTCGFGDRRSTNSSYWPVHRRRQNAEGGKQKWARSAFCLLPSAFCLLPSAFWSPATSSLYA